MKAELQNSSRKIKNREDNFGVLYEEEKYFCKKNNHSYFDNANDSYDLFISDGNNRNY